MIRKLASLASEAGGVLSRLVNVLFFGGEAHQALSSRAWLLAPTSRRWRIRRDGIDRFFFWQREHCRRAFLLETRRARQTLRANRRI